MFSLQHARAWVCPPFAAAKKKTEKDCPVKVLDASESFLFVPVAFVIRHVAVVASLRFGFYFSLQSLSAPGADRKISEMI